MKVIYDNEEEKFLIINEETATWINTNDIVEAREMFVERIIQQFNDAISKKLIRE